MTYAEECQRARLECLESQRAARETEANTPLSAILDSEFRRSRQQRNADGLERRAALWGTPTGTSFSHGTMGLRSVFRRP